MSKYFFLVITIFILSFSLFFLTTNKSIVKAQVSFLVPTFVNSAGVVKDGSSGVSLSLPASSYTSGNLAVILVKWEGTSATVSVSDTAGNTYTGLTTRSHSNGDLHTKIFYAKNIIGSPSNVVTVTWSAGRPFRRVAMHQYSGIDTSAPFDQENWGSGTSGTAISTNSVNTAQSDEVIVAIAGEYGSQSGYTPGANFTERIDFPVSFSVGGTATEDRILNASGSYNASIIQSNSDDWVMNMATFKAAISGSSPVPQPPSPTPTPTPPTPTPPPPADTTPPTISSIASSGITSSSATITWTTNESATASVQYGLTTSYGSTQNSGGTTSHSVTLTGLSPNTTYNYRISATDTAGNNSLSSNQTFITQSVVTPPTPTPTPTPSPSTPMLVDAFIDMNGSSVGTQTSPAVMTAGTKGNGITSWQVNDSVQAMKVGPQRMSLPAPIQVGSTVYPVNHPHQSLQYDTSYSFNTFRASLNGNRRIAVASGYFTPGIPDQGSSGSLSDLVRFHITSGAGSVMQLYNGNGPGYVLNIESYGGNTAHSAKIPVTRGVTYWYSYKADYVAGMAYLNVYDLPNFNLIGSVTKTTQTGTIEYIQYGNGEEAQTGSPGANFNYFEASVLDYTNAIFPLIPSSGGTSPPPPTPTPPPPTPTPPPPPPPSTKFTIGQRVQAGADVNVRATANTTGTLLGTQPTSALGTVTGGSTAQGGFNWWQIDYDNAPDGWSAEDFLNVYVAPTPTPPPPSPTPTPTPPPPTPTPSGSNPIDISRRIDWSQAGVSGGIVNRTNICTTLNPGATVAQINSAISSCNNGVVFLNAGTYNLSGSITFGSKSNVTLRGAGADQTILKFSSSGSCVGLPSTVCIGSAAVSENSPPNSTTWTAGYAPGTNVITVGSSANMSTGDILILDQLNDTSDTGNIFVCSSTSCTDEGGNSVGRTNRGQLQMVKVTSVNGNQVTINPSIRMPNWRASQSPGVWWNGSAPIVEKNGVEDLTLDVTSAIGGNGIMMVYVSDNWVKGVRTINADESHVWFYKSMRNTVRDSYFYGGQGSHSQSYGIQSYGSGDNLIENNIFQHVTGPIKHNGGETGSVSGYNFSIDDNYDGDGSAPGWMIPTIGYHEVGISFQLDEGNDGLGILHDAIHGTVNLNTAFRNHLYGDVWNNPAKSSNTAVINIASYGRYFNIVGNVLGRTGYYTTYETNLVDSGNRSIYDLGWSPETGQVPSDSLVKSTMFRWGNYDNVSNGIKFDVAEVPSTLSQYSNSIPSSQTLPASMYLSSKPSFFGNVPWPPIGPDVTGGTVSGYGGHANKIPARLCYENTSKTNNILNFNASVCYGTTPPPPPSPTPTPTPPPPTPPPPTPTPTPVPIIGDINLDHIVNSLDWSLMNTAWFTTNANSDLNNDGSVNSLDFALLSSNWLRTW